MPLAQFYFCGTPLVRQNGADGSGKRDNLAVGFRSGPHLILNFHCGRPASASSKRDLRHSSALSRRALRASFERDGIAGTPTSVTLDWPGGTAALREFCDD